MGTTYRIASVAVPRMVDGRPRVVVVDHADRIYYVWSGAKADDVATGLMAAFKEAQLQQIARNRATASLARVVGNVS